jgi:hypothetical protein
MCGHDDDVLSLANGSLPHKKKEISRRRRFEKSPEEKPSI